jgi:hypothetical protein
MQLRVQFTTAFKGCFLQMGHGNCNTAKAVVLQCHLTLLVFVLGPDYGYCLDVACWHVSSTHLSNWGWLVMQVLSAFQHLSTP